MYHRQHAVDSVGYHGEEARHNGQEARWAEVGIEHGPTTRLHACEIVARIPAHQHK